MQYLGINPRSSPNDQYFHSKVLNVNTTQKREMGGRGGRFWKQL